MTRGVTAGLLGIAHPSTRAPTSSSMLNSILGSGQTNGLDANLAAGALAHPAARVTSKSNDLRFPFFRE
jgi:hypothetical protein